MRFVSALHGERRLAGVLDGEHVVPLQGVTELGAATPGELLRDPPLSDERIPLAELRLRPVVPRPGKVVCVGLNYADHIRETGREDSDYPTLFTKFAGSLTGPYDPIPLPPETSQVDFEGELALVVGRSGRRIAHADALAHVAGFTVANDVSMRDYQYRTSQFVAGKAWDASTPLGPALVTPDEADVSDARLTVTLNGETMQESRTSLLIFDLATILATVSEFATLEPGDVILTGTPAGVGYKREPPVFLRDGDVVAVEIEGVGRLENVARAER